jgi:uncharacterized membrane protein
VNYLRRADLRLPITLVVVAVLVSLPLPFRDRSWHLFMHIMGAVLFIGNIIVTAAWMILAVRTKQPALVHFSAKAVNEADLLFTIPGVLLIFLNGLVLAPAFGGGNALGASWVVVALALLILSGIVWAGFLLRYQDQLVQLSASREQLSKEFLTAFRNWGIWGGIATVLPIISLILMVFKPTLWS